MRSSTELSDRFSLVWLGASVARKHGRSKRRPVTASTDERLWRRSGKGKRVFAPDVRGNLRLRHGCFGAGRNGGGRERKRRCDERKCRDAIAAAHTSAVV